MTGNDGLCRCGECRSLDRQHPSEGSQMTLIPLAATDMNASRESKIEPSEDVET